MKIYLAARYSRRLELCEYRERIQAMGHTVTSRWLNGCHQISDSWIPIGDSGEALIENGSTHCASQLREHFAQHDVEDVTAADLVISFTEQPRDPAAGRGGRHVEFGLALGLDITQWIIGPHENLFHWLPGVRQFESFDAALACLGIREDANHA